LELDVEERFDLIFSTATFHWIGDHQRLFRRLARALKPGGRLLAQCGGAGNIARVRAAAERVMQEERFHPHFAGWEDPWNFATPAKTRERLETAGFEGIETWLREEPTPFGSTQELARYLKAIVLGRHLLVLPEAEGESFAAAVAERLAAEGPPVVDYVRLNILAARSGTIASSEGEALRNRTEETV
jgi:trans-aconitate 2-methyltransferase